MRKSIGRANSCTLTRCAAAITVAMATSIAACGSDEPALYDPGGGQDGAAESSVDAADAKADSDASDAKLDADAKPDSADAKADAIDAKADVPDGDGSQPVDAEAGTDAGDAGCANNATLCNGVCVSLSSDPQNCGACGTVCPSGQVCNASVCSSTCGPQLTDCNGACVSLSGDPANCGSCGNACTLAHALAACTDSKCSIASCNAGFADCNGNPTDGCEVDTAADVNNCGGCGAPCLVPNATPACASGLCAVGSCKPGFADCDGTAANGCEVNLLTQVTHCGACGNACATGQVCNAGVCASSCAPGTTDCGGSCVTLSSDPTNCGQCGTVCVADHGTPACAAGQCVIGACLSGYADCNGTAADGCEVNIASSITSCGACNQACLAPNATPLCNAGTCTVGTCTPGFADCNGVAVDGCEINLATDGNNCGACAKACSLLNATPSCQAGLCVIASCQPGYADCNSQAVDGCEVGISSDVLNCGACGNTCAPAHATAACSSSTCSIASCDAGWADCDGLATDGCEVNVGTDPASCGGCGKVCSLANATAACSAGVCTVASCSAGFADCDGLASNGCEVNLGTDGAHCGTCGIACTSGQVCSSGVCTQTCGTGLTNCSGSCVSLSSDPANCGACGVVCSLPHATEACVSGACTVAACEAGYANCNAVAADGCEVDLQTSLTSCGACGAACVLPNATSTCTLGQCAVAACSTGWADCDGLASNGCEVNTLTDVSSCGGCSLACSLPNATAACVAGACAIASCNSGFGDCNTVASDGCEVNLTTSAGNCGACGNQCSLPNAVSTCSAGVCAINSCKPGYADCNGNPVDGCEVNLNTSVSSCGSCGAVCNLANATEACVSGQCTIASCSTGYADCDGLASTGCEANLLADSSHCGSCTTACSSGQVCSNGACTTGCATGLTNCNGSCVNLLTDVSNCGSCSFVCSLPNATASCSAGICGIASCNVGFANCDGLAADGCEVNTTTDANNCGACGAVCTLQNATAACSASKCAIASCNAGFGDCDVLPADGCEVSTSSDVANCGACGRACSAAHVASKSCASGVCNSTCQLGYGNCAMPVAPGVDDGCELDVSSNNQSCGSCSNSCSLQGGGGGLVCDGGQRPKNQCGCSSNGACSLGGGGGTCNVVTGLCSCAGQACHSGEVCAKAGASDVCTCNGATSCAADATCCQNPAGCRNLATDPQSCGACGHACPTGFGCASGTCACSSDSSCNAGAAGVCTTGKCVCGGTSCAVGQRCLAGGVCG